MKLYIKIQNNEPVDHPYLEDNLLECYNGTIPEEYVLFNRIVAPELGLYEKNQTVTYELVDGVYSDVWRCEQMDETERKEVDDRIAALEAAQEAAQE